MTEYGDSVNESMGLRRQAVGQASLAVAEDPEEAARALELGKLTGVDPTVVHTDVEGFEHGAKTEFAARLIQNNPHLVDYINSHPLAATVSNDDWAQLDVVSDKLQKYAIGQAEAIGVPEFSRHLIPDVIDTAKGMLDQAVEAPGKLFGTAEYTEEEKEKGKEIENFLIGQGVEPDRARVMAAYQQRKLQRGAGFTDLLMTVGAGLTGGLVGLGTFALAAGAFRTGVSRPIEEAGGLPIETTEGLAMALLGVFGVKHLYDHSKKQVTDVNITPADRERLRQVLDIAEPYLKSGEVPPYGIHEDIDKYHEESVKQGVKDLDELTRESQSASTRERSPEFFRDFTKRYPDAKVGIDAEAVRKLYGDKEPMPDDNLLGWVPGIAEQLRDVEARGGKVEVPLADWLTHIDPELAKELKEDIQVRPGSPTLREIEEAKERRKEEKEAEVKEEKPKEVEPPTTVETVREGAGLGPFFTQAPSKRIGLKKVFENDYNGHDFAITDEKGRTIGRLGVTLQNDGKTLYVDEIFGTPSFMKDMGGPGHMLSKAHLVSIIDQLKKEFPDIERITGHRVSGARKKVEEEGGRTVQEVGMVSIPVKGGKPLASAELVKDLNDLLIGAWHDVGMEGAPVRVLIPEKWTPEEQKMIREVDALLKRLIPSIDVLKQVQPALSISINRRTGFGGVFQQFDKARPIIAWSFNFEDTGVAVARHEAIHYLRQEGFIDRNEWRILRNAAIDGGWLEKHRILDRYDPRITPLETLIEEAIAEEFKVWKPKIDVRIDPVFGKIAQLLKDIRAHLSEIFGKDAETIFQNIESGRIGSRTPTGPRTRGMFKASAPELPGTRRFEDTAVSEAAAWGIPVPVYRRLLKLAEQQKISDLNWQLERARKDAERRQKPEWKENEGKVRQQVLDDIEGRPDISAANYFLNGILYGEKQALPKINPTNLTKEQKESISSKFTSTKGSNPDDIAGLLAFKSGSEMVDSLIAMERSRGGIPFKDYLKKIVDKEVTRRMERKFGVFEENVLSEARDHVLSGGMLDLLHEETVAHAMKAGAELPFKSADVQSWVKEGFEGLKAKGLKAANFLGDAGKAGKRLLDASTKQDWQGTFKEAQKKELSARYAKEAAGFEKEVKKGEKLIARYSKVASLDAVDQEYTDQIHSLLPRVGVPINRTEANLNLSLKGKSLEKFIAEKAADYENIPDPQLPASKSINDFTVGEYRSLIDTIQSLDYNGRRAKKIDVAGKAEEFSFAVAEGMKNLYSMKKEGFDPTKPGLIAATRRAGRTVDAQLFKAESLLDVIDKDDPRGIFNQIIYRPLMEAFGKRSDIIDKMRAIVKAIPVTRTWGRSLTVDLGNTILKGENGEPKRLTHGNKIVIALNWGNESNKSVLARGWGWRPDEVQAFLNKYMTRPDWNFVRGIWDVLREAGPYVEEATEKNSGVPIEMVQPVSVKTRFGTFKGGYYPLVPDAHEALVGTQRKTDLVDRPQFTPLPTARALHARTGTAYPVDLSLDRLASTINETLHAALFQEPVRNAKKYLDNTNIRKGINKAFGPEYIKLLDDWLKDVATNGGTSGNIATQNWISWTSRNATKNLAFVLVAGKLSTAVIHGVSAAFGSALRLGEGKNLGTGFYKLSTTLSAMGINKFLPDVAKRFFTYDEKMWEQVEVSRKLIPELRHRMLSVEQEFGAQLRSIVSTGVIDDLDNVRYASTVWGMKMLATLDQLTATPTGIAAYRKYLIEGMSPEEAGYAAGKAIRQAHGSPNLIAKANIMRGNAGQILSTLFYGGYWSHNYNANRLAGRKMASNEISWQDKLMIGSASATALMIAPAIVHWAWRGKEDETWPEAITDGLVSQFGGQIPFMNNLTYMFMHNKERDPHMAPIDTIVQKASASIADAKSWWNGKEAGKAVKHALETPGIVFGIGAPDQVGTAIQFLYDVYRDKEDPVSPVEWWRGLIQTGHAKAKSERRKMRRI